MSPQCQSTKPTVHRISITRARASLRQVVRRVQLHNECFVVEEEGIPVAAVVSVGDLEDWLELRDPVMRRQIAEGYAEYQRGRTRPLHKFLAEPRPLSATTSSGRPGT